MKNFLDRSCRETQNTHFMCSNFSFPKIVPLMGPCTCVCVFIYIYIYIYSRVDKAMHDNMAHAHCMVHTYVYKHTLKTCNTIAFSWQQWLHERASMLRYTHVQCQSLDPRLRRKPSILLPLFEFKSAKSLCLYL
jgi:hypothetical protein